jgi:cytochrome c6
MKKTLLLLSIFLFIILCSSWGLAGENSGKELYEKLCAKCHPDGGNKIKPDKPLYRKSLESHGIKSKDDIVNVMRNPGKGMKKFTEEKLSNEDAQKIAEYILETFK